MGQWYSTNFGSLKDVTPDVFSGPVFDPNYGFEEGRKEREMKVTQEEMQALGLAADERDYCAHHLVDFYKCRRDNFPWVVACEHVLHEWNNCQFNDYVLRMKEFERERRLLERAKRKGELDQVKNREVMVES